MRSQVKVSESILHIQFLANFLEKVFVVALFVAIGHKEHFRENNLTRIFKFCCFSGYHTYIFEKKKVRSLQAEFNFETIGTNFKSQKLNAKKLVCLFLIALFNFEATLIK